MQTDPLFRLPSKKTTRVPLDSRFARLLNDEQFSSRARVDRYGRRLRHEGTKGRNKELERLYRLADDGRGAEEEAKEEEESGEDDAVVQRELAKAGKQYDPARDGGFSESSSEESASDDDESEPPSDDEGAAAEGKFEFPDRQADDVPRGEVTSRLAVVNLDWDHIRAVDLMAVFSSFVPEGGRLLKVAVYPSEFGRERMDREAIEGPPKAIFPAPRASDRDHELEQDKASESSDGANEEEDDDEQARIRKFIVKEDKGEEFNPTLLRRYQLERLRYYYAVLTCSSPACAEALYRAVDGLEYLATANVFDLRFVPAGTDFADDRPRDECAAVPARYRPNEFVTAALQHSRVALTWDADDGKRKEVQKRAFGANRAEIDENDLKAYLGSDDSDDDREPIKGRAEEGDGKEAPAMDGAVSKKEQERQRMRALLGLGAEPEPRKAKSEAAPVGDMQITFSSGLSEHKGDAALTNGGEAETTIQKYQREEKERKTRRQATAKAHNGASSNDSDEEIDRGFDDPFFEAPEQTSRAAQDAERQKKRAADADAAQQTARETAALAEHLGADAAAEGDGLGRFDMRVIARGEKALRRAKSARGQARLRARDRAALEAKRSDRFRVDVGDPRFAAVYERSEFALDPGHPRFQGTEGMRTLLEEGRRKRAVENEDGDGRARRRRVV